jgi:predicted CXXCH cytochrome family protein
MTLRQYATRKRPHRMAALVFGVLAIVILVFAAGFLALRVDAASSTRPVVQPPSQTKPMDDYCLSCHGQPGLIKALPNGETLSLFIDPSLFNHSVHVQENVACVDCHTNISTFPHPDFKATSTRDVTLQLYPSCQKCHADQYTKTLDSVHQQALAAGNYNAAVCTDCHNPHQQTRMTDKKTGALLPEARLQIPQTCARCHSTIYDTYKNSVHGAALTTQGNLDVPTCIDCHGVHNIQNPTTTRFRNDIPQLCAKCHTDPKIMDKYGVSTQVLNTYVDDFHGTTVTLFEQISPDTPTNKLVCTDCHGFHDISNPDNPATGIAIKQNLLAKCQQCHPGATTANFTNAWMSHYIASPQHFAVVYYVNLFYKIFIPTIIGGMLIFVISDFIKRRLEARKGVRH